MSRGLTGAAAERAVRTHSKTTVLLPSELFVRPELFTFDSTNGQCLLGCWSFLCSAIT